jgi:hypothetical protein
MDPDIGVPMIQGTRSPWDARFVRMVPRAPTFLPVGVTPDSVSIGPGHKQSGRRKLCQVSGICVGICIMMKGARWFCQVVLPRVSKWVSGENGFIVSRCSVSAKR